MDTREHTVEVTGLETFRRVVCLTSLIAASVSGLILAIGPETCQYADSGVMALTNGVWLTGSVQISLFLVLLLHYVHCGCLIRGIGRGMALYYSLLIGCMIWAQIIFFKGAGCGSQAFVLYWWLAFNIGVFYVFVAYGLSLWGAYICWAQEEEEKIVKEAMQEQFEKLVATKAIEAANKGQAPAMIEAPSQV